ncbi:hypothetical protein Pvag_pPag30400 (plasmid) [Pantoea vagans C9-1]|nr:hypothetical protein Pvag_pPag30400 [Pantoea vagans C9-1]
MLEKIKPVSSFHNMAPGLSQPFVNGDQFREIFWR